MLNKLSKFTGCIAGLALGDALGCPLEGMKAGHIKQIFGEIDGFVDQDFLPPDNLSKRRLKGLYSDDTQQALAIADVLLTDNALVKESLADLYIRLLDEGTGAHHFGLHRGAGHNFKAAVLAMKENPGDLFSCGRPSAGNGAAMRIAPIGLFYCDDDKNLEKAVIEASLLTHNDPCGIAAAAAIAKAIAMLVHLGPSEKIDINVFGGELKKFVRKTEETLQADYYKFLDKEKRILSGYVFSDALSALTPILREANDDIARSTIINEANRHHPQTRISGANHGYAPASVIASLYYALKYKTFRDGVFTAVADGKDADTVGAITGALLGARLGIEGIETELLKNLKGREQVLLRGESLASGEIDYMRWIDLVEHEKSLTMEEENEIGKFAETHKHEIEKIREKKAIAAAKKDEQKLKQNVINNLDFAPPPEVWLNPEDKKKDKLERSKKRISWKETRREKKKKGLE